MFSRLLQTEKPAETVFVFLATYFITLAIGRAFKRRGGVHFGFLFQFFALTLAFYAAISAYGLQTTWRGHVGAILILLSTGVVVALLNRYLWDYYFETRRQIVIPRLLRDSVALVIFLVALLLVLSVGYQAQTQLKGLLAGSGVLAIILGFAAQNFLSSLVAGLSLQVERPYKVGDWLRVGDVYGEVMEINLGATKLRTNDAISLHIPNNEIVKQTITNLHYPSPLHAMRLSVGADYTVPPNRVKDALMRAVTHATGVMLEPAPKIYLKEFADFAIVYEIKFWMTNHSTFNDICDAIRTNIWYEFKRRKIQIPFPIRTVQLERKSGAAARDVQTRARAILRSEPLFACLSDEQIEALIKDAEAGNHFGRGEAVIEEGSEGDSMFVLLHGSAQVSVDKNGALIRVGVLRKGDCFGEMSLLTGEKRTATVRAERDCEVLEISKPVMGELLRSSPLCLDQLSALLAHRKMETEGILKEAATSDENSEKEREYKASFIKRVRSFFEL
ncbi:MAG: mechanosensitive ion channel family protein [Verrucomicrobiota bacterium]|nr:mechanosensitive ion channel family protein [Verrucomicrobiota bacterium]